MSSHIRRFVFRSTLPVLAAALSAVACSSAPDDGPVDDPGRGAISLSPYVTQFVRKYGPEGHYIAVSPDGQHVALSPNCAWTDTACDGSAEAAVVKCNIGLDGYPCRLFMDGGEVVWDGPVTYAE